MSAGGATFIQLRDKHLSPRGFYIEAERALQIARSRGALLIINDRVDIALALSADGVHLGQNDLPTAAARKLLGARSIIGFSTHNVEQAREAAALPIDYLAIGPIFPTSSKDNPDPVVGLEGLRLVREIVGDIPLVAIGGINHKNIAEVLKAGADAVAVIRHLLARPPQIESRTRQILTGVQAES